MGADHNHGATTDTPVASVTARRAMVGLVALLAAGALAGLAAMWPSGDRPPLELELGFEAELVDATVVGTEVAPCAGTPEEAQILCRVVLFEATSGSVAGREGSFQQSLEAAAVELGVGDRIVVGYSAQGAAGLEYYFVDFQRATPMLLLAGLFAAAVVALGRFQGVRALAGLVLTGVAVVGFLFPALLEGASPVAAALVVAVVIALVSLYLAHGVTERTTVALLGALGALGLTAGLAAVFTAATRLTGFGSEDAILLQAATARVDVQGLVLAGIIIGSLGVLDDVTVTQASAVWQLHRANPGYGVRQLYDSAIAIGRDHIASAVNTLVLAYAGAALPLLLLFTQVGRGLGEVATGEVVAVEIVRTLVGSVGLISSVPLTTLLAALVVSRAAGPAGGGAARRPDGAADGALAHEPSLDAIERW